MGDLRRINDDRAIVRALRNVGGTDLLSRGLAYSLSPRDSAGLSNGQWQTVALARAEMRESPILVVLDEPTSALDAAAESALISGFVKCARIAAALHGTISVVVSHRYGIGPLADVIVVLDAGRVVEQGDHETLVRSGGFYGRMFELQQRGFRD